MRGLVTTVGLAGVVFGAVAISSCSASAPTLEEPEPYGIASDAQDPRDTHRTTRLFCGFDAGELPSATVGEAAGLSKIEHVVVVMLENRSFDHLLSTLDTLAAEDRPPAVVAMPGPGGKRFTRYHERSFCPPDADLPRHEWGDVHLQLGAGRMDGFVAVSDCRALGYYDQSDLPILHTLAHNGAVSARYFSSLLGPTWPNRLFLFTGTSCGYAEGFDSNPRVTTRCGAVQRSWFQHFDDVQVFDESGLTAVVVGLGLYLDKPRSLDEFVARAGAGTLPKISFVGGSTGASIPVVNPVPIEDDGHPPSDIRRTELFLHTVARAVMKGPQWGSTALFITYDEHGGYYDHVKPPHACTPDGTVPEKGLDGAFDQYGFRVPFIVVSPWAKPGYVSRIDADHTSLLRFLELWQNKPALTDRDANAWPLLDMFDFTQSPSAPYPIPDQAPPDPGACTPAPPTCPPPQ